MEFFRGSSAPEVEEEVNSIIENLSEKKSKEGHKQSSLRQLATLSFLKPFSSIGIIYLSCSLSGYAAVSAYSNDYFDNAGARAMSYGTDSVILGSVKCLSTFLAPFILMKVCKKKLLVTCGFASSIGFILGNYILFDLCLELYHLKFLLQWEYATS